ncbi:hypothetical protein EDD90_2749 [Streptomyces sp. Ag109_O5-1]|uniref:hypothetical protein n=1 Tax=Streptomyces sp. Ag109_O5-1 TaxID=1938851 RepID=UPI000F502B0B|nr:hypothetical protein [Streptomyces sp. Ag109_O5-1]RPE39732.1 hypothetical protein EDD90_2749 [Streptomyces sp. Ag109_O5-1]
MLTHGTLLHRYQPTDVRLGRHHRLDARSLNYLHHHDKKTVLQPVRHEIPIPILDQQDLDVQGIDTSLLVPGALRVKALGSCTANAGTAALAFILGAAGLAKVGLSATDPVACERFAICLYHEETVADELPGEWPPDDQGSSGLGIARALKDRGLIDSYVHATNADALASLLQTGPVLLGVPWFQAWFTPDSDGFVDAGDWAGSGFAGGHEVLAIGLDEVAQDAAGHVIPEQTVIRLRNSWNTSWGLAGEFRLRLSTYVLLRRYIDAIQLRKAA